MELSFTFRNTQPSQAIKEYVQKKISILEKFVREPSFCHVIFTHEKFRYSAEVILEAPMTVIKAREEFKDMNSAFDLAIDVVKRQAMKFKDRKKSL